MRSIDDLAMHSDPYGSHQISRSTRSLGLRRLGTLLGSLLLPGAAAEAQLLSNVSVHVSSQTVADGYSIANAKAVPAALVEYQTRVENAGLLWLTANSLTITNPIPAHMSLYVGDLGVPGSGPVSFSEGPRASQLQCPFGGYADGTDCLEFSSDGGATFTYQPQPNSDGCDAAITHIRIRPNGSMAPAFLQPSSFVLRYRMKVK
ncbi:hypothetical protein [Sphingorhabdus contaminans]|uniref:Uncharacterized protein n=1 Tax=Sphingorhabdus contaminans TaxID=1343899 RepID=A0A553WA84_9SPHN|nr:hypothetical protein [Sphingorhabdus contaminans]TSB01593.1 hypothetical protein FOM92_10430 [Sphingorhabdus contaminans]